MTRSELLSDAAAGVGVRDMENVSCDAYIEGAEVSILVRIAVDATSVVVSKVELPSCNSNV